MIRSMPAFSVCVDAGQPTQAPTSSTDTITGRLVDVVQHDVAAVGLQGRTDDFDGFFDLFAHGTTHSMSARRTIGGCDRSVGDRHGADAASSPTRVDGTRSC